MPLSKFQSKFPQTYKTFKGLKPVSVSELINKYLLKGMEVPVKGTMKRIYNTPVDSANKNNRLLETVNYLFAQVLASPDSTANDFKMDTYTVGSSLADATLADVFTDYINANYRLDSDIKPYFNYDKRLMHNLKIGKTKILLVSDGNARAVIVYNYNGFHYSFDKVKELLKAVLTKNTDYFANVNMPVLKYKLRKDLLLFKHTVKPYLRVMPSANLPSAYSQEVYHGEALTALCAYLRIV